MDLNYPRYPVDFYRLRIAFETPAPISYDPPADDLGKVRENPFGTAFEIREQK